MSIILDLGIGKPLELSNKQNHQPKNYIIDEGGNFISISEQTENTKDDLKIGSLNITHKKWNFG